MEASQVLACRLPLTSWSEAKGEQSLQIGNNMLTHKHSDVFQSKHLGRTGFISIMSSFLSRGSSGKIHPDLCILPRKVENSGSLTDRRIGIFADFYGGGLRLDAWLCFCTAEVSCGTRLGSAVVWVKSFVYLVIIIKLTRNNFLKFKLMQTDDPQNSTLKSDEGFNFRRAELNTERPLSDK